MTEFFLHHFRCPDNRQMTRRTFHFDINLILIFDDLSQNMDEVLKVKMFVVFFSCLEVSRGIRTSSFSSWNVSKALSFIYLSVFISPSFSSLLRMFFCAERAACLFPFCDPLLHIYAEEGF